MKLRTMAALIAALFFTGTAYGNECNVINDEFSGATAVTVTQRVGKRDGLFSLTLARLDGTIAVMPSYFYRRWRFLGTRTLDEQGSEFATFPDRRVGQRFVMENIRIELPGIDYLLERPGGFRLKIYGQRAHEELTVSADLIADFLGCLSTS